MTNYSSQLSDDMKMQRPFESDAEELLLSFVFTESHLKKLSYSFFNQFEVTDVQFNILMLLADHSDTGLKQFEMADRMVVNRASLGGVVDRLAKQDLVTRMQDVNDRRANIIHLTPKGHELLKDIKKSYYNHVRSLFEGWSDEDKNTFSALMERLREQIHHLANDVPPLTT